MQLRCWNQASIERLDDVTTGRYGLRPVAGVSPLETTEMDPLGDCRKRQNKQPRAETVRDL